MNLEGVIPILPTPFNEEEQIDFEDVSRLVDFAIDTGVAAIGLPAFGSEFYKLSGEERERLIDSVIRHSEGRIPVIVQCNHSSPAVVASMARHAEQLGANAINTAIPRLFPASQGQLLSFVKTVCESVDLPVILQDWNPGGETIGLDFVEQAHKSCPNFRYVKYEESGIGSLVSVIETQTAGQVKTLTGWGGMFAIEMFAAGSVGVMPGFSLIDVFQRMWQLWQSGDWVGASRLHANILPFVTFSLQNLERFHHAEKQLLQRRGLIKTAKVRSVTIELDAQAQAHLDRLVEHLLTS